MKKSIVSIILLCVIVVLNSCQFVDDVFDGEEDEQQLFARKIEGNLILPDNSAVRSNNLETFSFGDAVSHDEDGGFEMTIPENSKPQLLITTNKDNKPVLLGLVDNTNGSFEVSSKSTAKSLVLLNPVFLLTSGIQRNQLLAEVESHPDFSNLVKSIEQLLISDPDNVLSIDIHPKIYENAALIAIDILKNADYNIEKSAVSNDKKPWIESAQKGEISIYNPKSVYFAANFKPGINDVPSHLIKAKSSLVSFGFSWPPVYFTEPTENVFNINQDDTYQVTMTKGFDFSDPDDFFNLKTINGKATLCNLGKTTGLLFDLIVGMEIPITGFMDLAFDGKENYEIGLRLGNHIVDGNTMGVIHDICDFVIVNKDQIFYYIRQELNPANGDNVDEYLSQAFSMLKNVAVVTKIVSVGSTAANKLVPFVYDIIAGDRKLQYTFTVKNGNLNNSSLNAPPEFKAVEIIKNELLVNTDANVNVRATDSENDKLAYRIHWGDGNSSEWSSYRASGNTAEFTYSYKYAGNYKIVAEVMDENGAIGELSDFLPITVYSKDENFDYNFDDDMVGGLPASPPWNNKQEEPSYLRVSNEGFGGSGKSCAFYDYDSQIVNNDDDGGVAYIVSNKKFKEAGSVKFSCRVSAHDDDFGVRTWQDDNYCWSEMGFYICFTGGNISYYYNGEFIKLMEFEPDYWYNFTIDYNTNEKIYSIYVNGDIKGSGIPYNGNPYQLTKFQVVAFSDASCKEALIDNISLPVQYTKSAISNRSVPNYALTLKE